MKEIDKKFPSSQSRITKANLQETASYKLWKEKEEVANNLAFSLTLKNLNREKFQQALNMIISRHNRLRSVFFEKDGQIYRKINPQVKLQIEEFKGQDFQEFVRPFDLEKGPLLRAAFIKNGILLDICHIVTDGISMALFFNELNAFYSGQSVSYEPETEENEEPEKIAVNTDFWISQVKEPFTNLQLPPDKKGVGFYGGPGQSLVHMVRKDLNRKVGKVCKKLKLTPFEYYFGAFLFFLHKESGLNDLVTSTNLSCRPGKTMHTIGLFANLAPIRFKIDEEMPAADFLKRVKAYFKQVKIHQNYRGEALLESLSLKDFRDLSRINFTFEHPKMAEIRLGGKDCHFKALPSGFSGCDMTFCFFPFKTRPIILVIFRYDLYSFQRVRKYLRSYVEVIKDFLHYDLPLSQFLR